MRGPCCVVHAINISQKLSSNEWNGRLCLRLRPRERIDGLTPTENLLRPEVVNGPGGLESASKAAYATQQMSERQFQEECTMLTITGVIVAGRSMVVTFAWFPLELTGRNKFWM